MKPFLGPEGATIILIEYRDGVPAYVLTEKDEHSQHYTFHLGVDGCLYYEADAFTGVEEINLRDMRRVDGKLETLWVHPEREITVELHRRHKGAYKKVTVPGTDENIARAGYRRVRRITNPFAWKNARDSHTRYCNITRGWWDTENGNCSPFLNYQEIHCQPVGTGEEGKAPREGLIALLNEIGEANAAILSEAINLHLERRSIEANFWPESRYVLSVPTKEFHDAKIRIGDDQPDWLIEEAICWLTTLSCEPLHNEGLRKLLGKHRTAQAFHTLRQLQCDTLNIILEWQRCQTTNHKVESLLPQAEPKALQAALLKAGSYLPSQIWEEIATEALVTR